VRERAPGAVAAVTRGHPPGLVPSWKARHSRRWLWAQHRSEADRAMYWSLSQCVSIRALSVVSHCAATSASGTLSAPVPSAAAPSVALCRRARKPWAAACVAMAFHRSVRRSRLITSTAGTRHRAAMRPSSRRDGAAAAAAAAARA